jgi:hypothetical protein
MSKIAEGVALVFGGGAAAVFGDVLGVSYSYLSIVLFALAGLLIAAGLYEEFKKTPK